MDRIARPGKDLLATRGDKSRPSLSALTSAEGARLISVSSVGHVGGEVDLSDVNFERRIYDPWVAYGQSKTANILFAVEVAKRWTGDGIVTNALNPGRIPSTNLKRHLADVATAVAGTEST